MSKRTSYDSRTKKKEKSLNCGSQVSKETASRKVGGCLLSKSASSLQRGCAYKVRVCIDVQPKLPERCRKYPKLEWLEGWGTERDMSYFGPPFIVFSKTE